MILFFNNILSRRVFVFTFYKVISNDVLFAGESSYGEELENFVVELVKSVFSNSTDIRGRVSVGTQ